MEFLAIGLLNANVTAKSDNITLKNHRIFFLDFAKVFLITLNGIFGLLGLAMLGIGGYVMVEVKKYSVSSLLIAVRERYMMKMYDPGRYFALRDHYFRVLPNHRTTPYQFLFFALVYLCSFFHSLVCSVLAKRTNA